MLKWLAQLGFTPKDLLVVAAVFAILIKVGVLRIKVGKNGNSDSVDSNSLDMWLRSQKKTAESIAESTETFAKIGKDIHQEVRGFKEKFIELAAVMKERMPKK